MKPSNTERRGRSATRLSSLACLVALVLSTLMVLSSPADATPGTGGANGQASDESCKSAQAADRPGSPCQTGGYGGAMGGVDASSLAQTLLTSVAKSAGSKIGGQVAGWALQSIFGPNASGSEELTKQINVLQGQMTGLQQQVHQLDVKLGESLKQLMIKEDRDTYELAASQVTTDASALADYQVHLDAWMKDKPGSEVDGSQSAELLLMRGNLGTIIQHLDKAMVGTSSTRGLIAMYRDVVANHTPYAVGRFYTSDFTTPMSDMLDYYDDLAVQAFNQLAEVNHLSWTLGDIPYKAENGVVETYAGLVPEMLAHWNQLATGGAGRLPDDVVADTGTHLLWSRSNLTIGGQKVFCWAACGADLSLSTLLTPDTVIDGLTGWSVPTQAQFTALASGQGQGAFKFLTDNGFQWQRDGLTVTVNNVPITAPAYWSTGGTQVSFAIDSALHLYDTNHWPFFLPGPGAVAVRPMG